MKKENKKRKSELKGKRPKPLLVKVADDLIKKYDENKKLRSKKINTSFLDLF